MANCDAQPAATQITETGAVWLDGTGTAKDAFLNFLIDEDGANATSTGAFTGVITITWLHLGDN